MTVQRILVGIDGSAGAARALRWAAELGVAVGAEVIAVHAHHPVSYPMAAAMGYGYVMTLDNDLLQTPDEVRDHMRRLVDEWCAPLGAANRPHRVLIGEGEPATVIMDIAKDKRADLIVVGRRGHGGFAELVLGSVSHHVTHHAPCPVVVVPIEPT